VKVDILIYLSSTNDDDLTFAGEFVPSLIARRLREAGIEASCYYSVPSSYSGRLSGASETFVRTGEDDARFWKDLFARTGADHLCKILGESPFFDPSVADAMIRLHLEQHAEFTYSENLPAGLTCEIIAKELIASIPDFDKETLPISQVVKANINQFDVELYYREPDIRDKRLSFLLTSPRDKRIMENLHQIVGAIPPYESLRDIIDRHPETLFIGPSYLEIELTGACDCNCVYCYRTYLSRTHDAMEISLIERLINQMRAFELPYTVCFGGSGEPLMHPHFYEILALVRREQAVERIIIETNGIAAGDNYRAFLLEPGAPVITIVNLSARDAETYRAIHGADCYDTVHDNILALAASVPDRVYVQIMKINETEAFLDAFYDYWETHKVPIILQKQNTYIGRIPDRRYSDLSPIERIPCWHLQRDLYITSDGNVSFCKQDIDASHAIGNISSASLSSIWNTQRGHFLRDYRREYPSAPNCAACDEWYTFNF